MTDNNLRFLRKRMGLTQTYIAEKLKISQSAVVRFEKGILDPTEPQKKLLANLLDVSIDDLFDKNLDLNIDRIKIDILDTVACCGDGNENTLEHIIGSWCMPSDLFKHISSSSPKNIKMIQVYGDSMQPTLKAGDWVLVDISHNYPDNDGLFVLWLTTGLAVKRIQGGLNSLIIHSDNPQYKDITASSEDIRIVGKVIYILKSERVG